MRQSYIIKLPIRNRSTNQIAGNSLFSSEIILKWGRGSERPAAHTQQKLTQVTPRDVLSVTASTEQSHFAPIRGRSCVKNVIFLKVAIYNGIFKVNFAFIDFQLTINLLFLVCFGTVFIYSTKIQECCQEGVQGANKVRRTRRSGESA